MIRSTLTPDSNVAEHEGLSRAAAPSWWRLYPSRTPVTTGAYERPHRPVAGPAAGLSGTGAPITSTTLRESRCSATITEPGKIIAPYLGAQLNAFFVPARLADTLRYLDMASARHIMGDRADIGWDMSTDQIAG